VAQGRLIAAGVLVGGAVTEAAAPTVLAGVRDWLVGAAFVAAALTAPVRRDQVLGLLTAALWFLATAVSGTWPWLAGAVVLAHRGPLLHWLTAGRRRRVLIVAGYLVSVAGGGVAAFGTALLGGWFLGPVWAIAATGLGPPILWEYVGDVSLILAAAYLARRSLRSRPSATIGELVVDLGPTGRPAGPVTARLAAALADPDLRLRVHRPDTGWTDESGVPVEPPGPADAVTAVDTPGGGRVLLLHGSPGAAGTDLSRAAAGAAALVLERILVEARVRRQAEEVRRSTARLMSVNDAERQALGDQVRAGALARLDEVRASLARRPGTDGVGAEVVAVIAELERLAAGLDPAAISSGGLPSAVRALVAGAGVPVRLELLGDLASLPPDTAALAYYIVAECLTNIARHAGATTASVTVRSGSALTVEVSDDGRGGATRTARRGLAGLADRLAVARGTLEITSPPGGPTHIRATLPI
jgi:hypothetical protein